MINVEKALIVLEINEKEADCFRKMREARAFDIRNGSITLHFDAQGNLCMLDKHLIERYRAVENSA